MDWLSRLMEIPHCESLFALNAAAPTDRSKLAGLFSCTSGKSVPFRLKPPLSFFFIATIKVCCLRLVLEARLKEEGKGDYKEELRSGRRVV